MTSPPPYEGGHFLSAIGVDRLRLFGAFQADMDDMLEALKGCPPAEGQARVLVPSEPELEVRETLRKLAAEYGTPVLL